MSVIFLPIKYISQDREIRSGVWDDNVGSLCHTCKTWGWFNTRRWMDYGDVEYIRVKRYDHWGEPQGEPLEELVLSQRDMRKLAREWVRN